MFKIAVRESIIAASAFALALGAYAAEEPKSDPYTLSTCIISGKALGENAVVKTIEGREVRFCCDGCPEKFTAKLEANMKKLDAAMIADQKPFYPLEVCAAMPEDKLVEGETVDIIYKNRLVRFCCEDCIPDFKEDPAKFLAAIDKAAMEKAQAAPQKTCVVSGEEIKGEGASLVVASRVVKFCCKDCISEFEKNPALYLGKLTGQPAAEPAKPAEGSGKSKREEKREEKKN